MEPFEIELTGTVLTIHPLEDGSFKVVEGNNYVGTIKPEIKGDTSIDWTTADLMSTDFAQQIGELIEEHEM